jgi:hypothetical protein
MECEQQIINDEDEDHGIENDDGDGSEFSMLLADIVHTVSNLYELSFVIRNRRSKQSKYRKAESFQLGCENSGVDGLQYFHRYDRMHVLELMDEMRRDEKRNLRPDPAPTTTASITERLTQGLTKRRRQFRYWENHDMKLSAQPLMTGIGPSDGAQANEIPRPTVATDAATESTPGKTAASKTEATHFEQLLVSQDPDARSTASFASTLYDVAGNEAPFPSPPKVTDGQNGFKCPYCQLLCPLKDLIPRRWR